MNQGDAATATGEVRMQALVDRMGPRLSRDERTEILHYVTHGEYAVALEALCAVVKDGAKQLSDDERLEIRALQRLMKLKRLAIDE